MSENYENPHYMLFSRSSSYLLWSNPDILLSILHTKNKMQPPFYLEEKTLLVVSNVLRNRRSYDRKIFIKFCGQLKHLYCWGSHNYDNHIYNDNHHHHYYFICSILVAVAPVVEV
jgi:hypothetical protein